MAAPSSTGEKEHGYGCARHASHTQLSAAAARSRMVVTFGIVLSVQPTDRENVDAARAVECSGGTCCIRYDSAMRCERHGCGECRESDCSDANPFTTS